MFPYLEPISKNSRLFRLLSRAVANLVLLDEQQAYKGQGDERDLLKDFRACWIFEIFKLTIPPAQEGQTPPMQPVRKLFGPAEELLFFNFEILAKLPGPWTILSGPGFDSRRKHLGVDILRLTRCFVAREEESAKIEDVLTVAEFLGFLAGVDGRTVVRAGEVVDFEAVGDFQLDFLKFEGVGLKMSSWQPQEIMRVLMNSAVSSLKISGEGRLKRADRFCEISILIFPSEKDLKRFLKESIFHVSFFSDLNFFKLAKIKKFSSNFTIADFLHGWLPDPIRFQTAPAVVKKIQQDLLSRFYALTPTQAADSGTAEEILDFDKLDDRTIRVILMLLQADAGAVSGRKFLSRCDEMGVLSILKLIVKGEEGVLDLLKLSE